MSPMKTTPTTFLFLLLTTAVLPCALAQEPPQQRDPETLSFDGGSLAEFAHALRVHQAKRDGAVNIVLPEAAGQVRVPAMELTSASVGDALQAVNTVLSPEVSLQVERYDSPGHNTVWAVGVHRNPRQPVGSNPNTIQPQGSSRTVGVLSLTPITPSEQMSQLYTIPAATVLTAIETALQVQGDSDSKLRYHPETNLLFVEGSHAQVSLAQQVLAHLQQDVTAIRNEMERARQRAEVQETSEERRPDGEKSGRSGIR